MPSTLGAEYQLLSDLISMPEYIPIVSGVINLEMFSLGTTKALWSTLLEMHGRGDTIDLTTVSTRIDAATLAEVTNPRYMVNTTPLAVLDHSAALNSTFLRKLLFTRGRQLMEEASNTGSDINELVSIPGKIVEEIRSETRAGRATLPLVDVLNEVADQIQQNQELEDGGKKTRVPTGLSFLDNITYSGFAPGSLVILAARPSVGKTAIGLQMAKTAAKNGFSVSTFSLEMTREEYAQRLLISTGLVTTSDFANRCIQWENLERANRVLESLPIYINDTAKDLEEIVMQITLNHHQGRCDIAFIDYLGLIRIPNNKAPIPQAIAEITGRLKVLAKECRIPIVLLCQLNRNNDIDKRSPELFDLRDSGSIEQDADIVLMLERKSRDLTDPHVSMWVRKNRQGRAGNLCINLTADKTFTRFEEAKKAEDVNTGRPPPRA